MKPWPDMPAAMKKPFTGDSSRMGIQSGVMSNAGARGYYRVLAPPDMIAARSRGLPAIAVPGDHARVAREPPARPAAARRRAAGNRLPPTCDPIRRLEVRNLDDLPAQDCAGGRNPIIADGTDLRFLNELKRELKA